MRFSAFISYKRTSGRAAERLKRDLYAIAKRHAGHSDFKIFLDTSDLRPGTLSDEIRTAVEQSRCLVVVLDRGTHESAWVAQEIAHWLATAGTPERLFLVRVDPEVGLEWDAEAGTFRDDKLPAPLLTAFDAEQKWIDYFARWSSRGLTGLCAKLMDVEPSEYLFEEATYQRRRARVITAIAVAMALLLAAATYGLVTAVRNQREAERNAAQARAQADASEALLAAADAPTLAIERALRAAQQSDSPTVRSAMLAVSHASRRLEHALVPQETVAAARFSPDGKKLLAWGDSHVQVWDALTGASVGVVRAEVRDVTTAGDRHLAGCGAGGAVLIELGDQTSALGSGTCSIHPFADGVVLHSGGSAFVVDHRGSVVKVDGVDGVSAHPSSRSVAVSGPSGVTVVFADRRVPVSAVPASVTFADPQGGFLVRFGPQEWGVVAGEALRVVRVPDVAVDVAPMLVNGARMTGDLVWLAGDGTIGWTRDDRRTAVESLDDLQLPYASTLEPLGFSGFVAVHHNTAVVVRPPTDGQWTQQTVPRLIGNAPSAGADPIVARCTGSGATLVRTDVPAGGSLLLGESPEVRTLTTHGQFTAACDAIDAGASLTLVPQIGQPVLLRSTLVADSVAVSPTNDRVAVVKTGFPLEILSTVPAGSLPRPWDVTTSDGGAVTALGERELFTTSREFVIADAGGVIHRVPIPEFADLVAPRPDGQGAALMEVRPPKPVFASTSSAVPGVSSCTSVAYVPGADFSRSVAAAEAQIPVSRVDGRLIDCRDGREVPAGPEVLSYEISRSSGQIVTRSGSRVRLTTWARGFGTPPVTVDGPDVDGVTSFDPAGQVAVTHVAGARHLTLHHRNGSSWTTSLTLATGLPGIVAARVVDSASLVLAVSADGGFELFDVATGRLVASDPGLSVTSVAGFSARRVGDHLHVGLLKSGSPLAVATVQIPIGVPALRRQLCSLYPAPECR